MVVNIVQDIGAAYNFLAGGIQGPAGRKPSKQNFVVKVQYRRTKFLNFSSP